MFVEKEFIKLFLFFFWLSEFLQSCKSICQQDA